ncbi:MAG: tetratricopeptide repeat protein [Planctomycetes bacterium]|nr:tetratricopeptide repeat protein [Planctomycetota bacterium]
MGRALVNLGHVRAGRRCLELSVAQKPRAAEPYVLLARLYLDLNRLPEALDLYREALRREPGDASLRLRLGAVLLYLRRPREALAEFRAAKERGAAAGVVEPRIGAALLALGEIDAARAACAAAGDAPEARAGSRLLELLAAGADPAQDPELARPAARTWLRCLALSPLAGAPAAPVLQGDK